MNLSKLLGQAFPSDTDRVLKNENAMHRYHSKRLAKKLGVTLELGRDPCGWYAWVLADEIEGEQFATSWQEVHNSLEHVEDLRTI